MNSNTQKSNVQDFKMDRKHNTKHNHSIESRRRRFYKAISEMKQLDELAAYVDSWETKYGRAANTTPTIYDIGMQQRERLITAMWYYKTLSNLGTRIEDAEIDAYLQWKVEVLATI